LQYQSYISN